MQLDESTLRDLIAKWRNHWAVDGHQSSDRESSALGSGIEHCADELEALLDQSSASTRDVIP
jgi:hypothetical protein